MSTINRSGAPNRMTKGAIGDIYIDTDTGAKYECAFACRLSGEALEYKWQKISDGDKAVVDPIITPITETDNNKDRPKPVENNGKTNPVVVNGSALGENDNLVKPVFIPQMSIVNSESYEFNTTTSTSDRQANKPNYTNYSKSNNQHNNHNNHKR